MLASHLRPLIFAYATTSVCAILLSAATSNAVTLGAISNASRVVESSTAPKRVIYGGTAGGIPATVDTNSPVNNCKNPTTADRHACNDARIHPSLRLVINLTPDADGVPMMVDSEADTSAVELESDSPARATKGTPTSIIATWGKICSMMDTALVDSQCITTSAAANKTFNVGVDTNNDGKLDESESVKIVVSSMIGQSAGNDEESLGLPCDSTDPLTVIGLCHFEVFPGDQKVTITNPYALNGFPTASPLNFRKIRVLWEPATGDATDPANLFTFFQAINSNSPHQDVEIQGTSPNITLSPARIDTDALGSSSLKNDLTYVFAVAAIDEAGNVGHYSANTSQDQFTYCAKAKFSTTLCKSATPSEVAGLLSKNMNCFIATASYGSIMAPQVETFRRFRDQILLSTQLGHRFVRFYYEHSPYYANLIAKNEFLRSMSRAVLWPLLVYAWMSLKFTALGAFLIVLTALMSLALVPRAARLHARASQTKGGTDVT